MRVALVHDYLGEFGGAERVLLALSEIWPDAPIYTAFWRRGPAWERFKDKDIRVSWAHWLPFFSTKLHSPLRFLAPLIWNSFNFKDFDVVITSASWFVTKGVVSRGGPTSPKLRGAIGKPIEICYCHTPPRYLYVYPTSLEWQKYWPVRVYAAVVNHFMRMYDFWAAQKVDFFIANSQNTRRRIQKFYRRDATVIYPPVELRVSRELQVSRVPRDYYLIVARIVGGKGLDMAVEAAKRLGFNLKVVGEPGGYATVHKDLKKSAGKNIEFLGYVEDSELAELYAGARAFLALAEDEDFGITPVEAMMAGTPVIAYRGGGYIESVVEGKTGLFFDSYSVDALVDPLKRFDRSKFDSEVIKNHAQRFSKERFKEQIRQFVQVHLNTAP